MDKVTKRFLDSISFDCQGLEIEMKGYRKIDDIWVYDLNLEEPWSYSDLERFLSCLVNIKYPYKINFSYQKSPKVEDAISLFDPWYSRRTYLPSEIEINIEQPSVIQFVARNEVEFNDYNGIVRDFNDLLLSISYPFIAKLILKEVNEEDEFYLDEPDEFSYAEEEGSYYYDDEIPPHDDDDLPYYDNEGTRFSAKVTAEIDERLVENMAKMKEERAKALKRESYIPLEINQITLNDEKVDFDGIIFSYEEKFTKNQTSIFIISVAKNTHAINVKAFVHKNSKQLDLSELRKLRIGQNVRVKGVVKLDSYSKHIEVVAHSIDSLVRPELRKDNYIGPKKRIELHAHTKMSVMDGIGTVENYIEAAEAMGHTALAITDHGVVQAFPEIVKKTKDKNIKMIYGAELYMIDTKPNFIINPSPVLLSSASYTVFDFETTGLSARYDRIIEFGAVRVIGGLVSKRINILINPGNDVTLSPKTIEITNIKPALLRNKPQIDDVIDEILDFIGDSILVSHNAEFDVGFLNEALIRLGRPKITNPVIDTLPLSRYLFPEARDHRLGALARNLEVIYDKTKAHRADYDAEVLNNVWQAMLVKLTHENETLRHMDLEKLEIENSVYRHLFPYHIVVLAKNQQGIKDLYELISLSHIDYLAEVPKIPRHIIEKYRTNLLISPACFNGEIFQLAMTKSEEDLVEAMSFYDYIEIQPPANYSHLINMGRIEEERMLFVFLKDIVRAAKKAGKYVVATGDAHYVEPNEKPFRDVLISAKAVGNVPHPLHPYDRDNYPPFENPDQHYRTTEEMLDAFTIPELFSLEEAKQYVIENTHIIANQIDNVKPLKEKLYTPKIENVDTLLRQIVEENAVSMYGYPLPALIKNRLDKELEGIIVNGFAVIYYLSYKIVKKAESDGYMVGSRGSVGSSLVATMAGITEVNPLIPHYRCPHCKYSDFEVASTVKSGFDLPNKKCPKCGHDLIGDGQNIPFETFLGFKADKVPDIDLNFPGDYQARAHMYTRELLGESNVYRAGTIETIKEKTAVGYVKGFFERQGVDPMSVNPAQINYLAHGITNVKRTSGQHPGGIVIIPDGYDVSDFTPVQYPANDIDAEWKTTHLDYRSIHDNVLKFDLLGHVDPLALKMMGEMTGIDPASLPFNDSKVLSLFSSPDALNLNHNYLEEPTGALGLPEFGTEFVRRLLTATNPKTFNDLLIISGLSHGTNVWTGNAERLIANKITDLNGVIGCRDDIMTYLISRGIEAEDAFMIMETVRKEGRKITSSQERLMLSHGVAQYYVDSCNMIEYLFPRAHATAYVMMAVRVGWYKVYRPLAYYATFFSVRCRQYDIKSMTKGTEAIKRRLKECEEKLKSAGGKDAKEKDLERTLQIALEFADRGYKFTNIDLYKSDGTTFVIDEENKALIPPFNTIDGLGDNTAISIVEARKDGEFISIEELVERTRLNSQNIERMRELGILKNLPEKNQLNLFDFF